MTRALIVGLGFVVAAVLVWHPAPPSPPVASVPDGRVAGGAVAHARSGRRGRPARAGARSAAAALVYVVGAVRRPGLYRLAPGARVDAAIAAAGGLLPGADPAGVNLAAPVGDGEEIDAPLRGQTVRRAARSRRPARRKASPPPGGVALNAADAATLARVPGVGPIVAARIVALRAREGPYDDADELLDVSGMTPAKLDRARPFLRVP